MFELAETIIGISSKVIDRIFPDKVEADKAKLELLRLQQEGQFKEMEIQMSAIIAEAKSSDIWTSRARPSFLYVVYIMILFSIPMGILSVFNPEAAKQIAEGMKAWLNAIPEGLWVTFGIGYSGYTIARSAWDKRVKK